ncbi:MAG: DNA-3-methyladenine glycosylase I [Legionellales bacterium]|nr:DNA-3-methyladenine glycosylase I [Legionellales bacterium]
MVKRCEWCNDDPLYQHYHDHEWGKPLYDEQQLFEFLLLEGMQAGLSWITILRKRDHYRKVFYQFDAEKIVRYVPRKFATLMQDPGIIRNKRKIEAIIDNAKIYLDFKQRGIHFSDYLWQFVDGKPIINHWKSLTEIPAETLISQQLSKTLKKAGFRFVGPTICYAFMQAVGMVNDHMTTCFLYNE